MTPAAGGQASELAIFHRHSPDPASLLEGDKDKHKYLSCVSITHVRRIRKGENGTTSAIAALHLRVDAGTKAYHRI